jgi:hypothetical protein
MNACDHSKQGLETQIASETHNGLESEVTDARHWQAWRLRTKIVTKFMSYVLQTPRLQKPENSRIV